MLTQVFLHRATHSGAKKDRNFTECNSVKIATFQLWRQIRMGSSFFLRANWDGADQWQLFEEISSDQSLGPDSPQLEPRSGQSCPSCKFNQMETELQVTRFNKHNKTLLLISSKIPRTE